MEKQMLLDNLDEKLEDETAIITAKWLAITFDQSLRESENILLTYIAERPHLAVVYQLIGITHTGHVTVKLTSDDRLQQVEATFLQKPTRCIYSIQKHPCKDSNALASVDMSTSINTEALKKLVTIPWFPTDAPRAPLVCRENKMVNLIDPIAAMAKPAHPTADKAKSTQPSNFFQPEPKLVTIAPSKRSQKRPSDFFNTKTSKPSSPKKIQPARPILNSKDTPTPSEDQPSNRDEHVNKEEEEEEEFLTSSVRKSNSKRKRIIIDSDEDDENLSPTRSKVSVDEFSQPCATRKMTPKKTKHVLVPDSETESPASKSSAQNRKPKGGKGERKSAQKLATLVNAAPTSPKPSPIRAAPIVSPEKRMESATSTALLHTKPNKRKRQVMKTFTDEDGFMVTEKVWESASEDDEPAPSEHKSTISSSGSNIGLTAAPTMGSKSSAKPPKSQPKAASKQASLSSFFAKV